MLQYSSNRYGKHRTVDIADLWLPDNRKASDMDQGKLFAELKKLGCPRVNQDMGRAELLFCLGVHQQEQREAARESAQ
jgi:hypothetical protein